MTQLSKILTDIERFEQRMTPGPWEVVGNSIESNDSIEDVVTTDVECSAYCYGGRGGGVVNSTDAEFIAYARQMLPRLANVLERVHLDCIRIAKYTEHSPEAGAAQQGVRLQALTTIDMIEALLRDSAETESEETNE